MATDPDAATRAGALAWQSLIEAIPGGWVRHAGDAFAVVTGIALPGFNGVWGNSASIDEAAVASLLGEVAAAGVPYCLQLRPGWPPGIVTLAADNGLTRTTSEPLMVLEDDRRLADVQASMDVSIRLLSPDEGHLHAMVAAAGFEEAEEPYRRVMTPEVIRSRGMRCYVGELDGCAVTTCFGVTAGESVGIFGVATLPACRRRGYAAAVTARAVSDGFADGASWAWLCSSEAGCGVYAGLGFTEVERWDIWESAALRGRRRAEGESPR